MTKTKVQSLIKYLLVSICFLVVFASANLLAMESELPTKAPAISPKTGKVSQLYSNNDNSFIQQFTLIGRYHGQYWWSTSEGNSDRNWENRRMYVGGKAKLFTNITVEIQASLNDNFDPIYEGLYDAFIKWQPSESNFAISLGRLDYVYTGMERSTSSKKINTVERALLVNQIMPGEVFGAYIKDTIGDFSYQTGIFSGSIKDAFTDFKGGFATLIGMQYNLQLFYDKGSLHLDYLYNNGNANNNAFKPYGNIISLWHKGQKGAAAFGIDVTVATGVDDQSDVFALTLLPTFELTQNLFLGNDMLQLAMRYHYASSSNAHGLSFNKRYEQPVASGQGDSYNACYIGLSYFMYQQKLKIMAGMEYFTMNNVSNEIQENFTSMEKTVGGWNISTGFRLYF